MPFTLEPPACDPTVQHTNRFEYPNRNSSQAGFVLVVCLIITLIVGLGSIALIRYSNSQTQMVSMSGFQTLLRSEAHWIADHVVHELQGEQQLNGSTATNDATKNQCNQLPNGVNSVKNCVVMPTTCTNRTGGCHEITLTSPTTNSNNSGSATTSTRNLYAGKTIKIQYLGEVPTQGTADEHHHLYRIDVTLKLNEFSITERRLVALDRIGV